MAISATSHPLMDTGEPRAPLPAGSGPEDDLYRAYERYTVEMQQYREECYTKLADELEQLGGEDKLMLARQLREKRTGPPLMTPAEFHAWWGNLDCEQQREFRCMYSGSVAETMRREAAALQARFKQSQ